MDYILFPDCTVPYDTFMIDLVSRLEHLHQADVRTSEYITQDEAYDMFGKNNVMEWQRSGCVKCKIEPVYKYSELLKLQKQTKDNIEK